MTTPISKRTDLLEPRGVDVRNLVCNALRRIDHRFIVIGLDERNTPSLACACFVSANE
jgi:hypothetical protein